MVGEAILHYKIIQKIGEGGMGVVYKAEDTKLERSVAIKFLPGQIAVSSENRERFKIEAKAAAALNHPNIATIHAIEEVNDEMFIVMEYIEGKELKELTTDNRELSNRDAINYAMQIAEGLKAYLTDWATQLWVKTTGKRLARSDYPWLDGPVGPTHKIGAEYFDNLAIVEKLKITITQILFRSAWKQRNRLGTLSLGSVEGAVKAPVHC